MGRLQHRVDAPRQLFLEPVEPGRAVEVGRPQFAQVGLERVHDARHQRLDALDEVGLGQFEHDLHLEILRAVGAGVGEVDQHVRQVDEGRGLDHGLLGLLGFGFAVAGEHEAITAEAAAAQNKQRGHRDDDRLFGEFGFGLGCGLGVRLRVVRLRLLLALGRHE